ncbi:MAG: DNA alkylation repair protein [Caldilineales bacterium]|nr:DNA alkylation repair protein [Caldilineales bacterium]
MSALDISAELASIRSQIIACADPEYQAGSSRVGPTAQHVYGARTPDMRAIARNWLAAHKHAPVPDLRAVVEGLWSANSRDERMISLFLLEGLKRRWPQLLDWPDFDHWRRDIDNWIVCDELGTKVFGPWIALEPELRLGYLNLLIVDKDLWSRRLALVAAAPLNRHPKTAIPDQTLAMIDRVKQERDPMITKAVSWVLREMTKTNLDRVVAYLHANRTTLTPHVRREVENKLTTGLKSGRSAGAD